MVRVLEPENFEKNRQALLRFESQMVELGGIKGHLTNSKSVTTHVPHLFVCLGGRKRFVHVFPTTNV